MSSRNISLFFTIGTVFLSGFLLITGSKLLNYSLSSSLYIPLGTFITWTGLVALTMSIYLGTKRFDKKAKNPTKGWSLIFKILIALSISWLPVCYLLAGNISFSFSEKQTFQGGQLAMEIFWGFSYFLVGAPIVLFVIYLLSAYYKSVLSKK